MKNFIRRWFYEEIEILGTMTGLAWVTTFFIGGYVFGSIVNIPSMILGGIMIISLIILLFRALGDSK